MVMIVAPTVFALVIIPRRPDAACMTMRIVALGALYYTIVGAFGIHACGKCYKPHSQGAS
jgi:hypothetical protein